MAYVPQIPDSEARRTVLKNRARSYATYVAAKQLREAHETEYRTYYLQALEAEFKRRGLT